MRWIERGLILIPSIPRKFIVLSEMDFKVDGLARYTYWMFIRIEQYI
mgnify:CR=1 FL=1